MTGLDATISSLSASKQLGHAKQDLHEVSKKLEATFVFEMLKSAGVGKSRGDMGGGAGEDQFASMLLQQQSELIANSGGLGLADSIYKTLLERTKNDT